MIKNIIVSEEQRENVVNVASALAQAWYERRNGNTVEFWIQTVNKENMLAIEEAANRS